MEWALYYYIQIEPRDIIYRLCRNKNGIIIDVGANFGEISLTCARLFPLSKIISIEPNPLAFKKLIHNISLNNFTNLYCFNVALGNDNKEIYFNVDIKNLHGGSVGTEENSCGIKMYQNTLDDLLRTLPYKDPVILIKIDTEGYEKFILEGALKTLNEFHPVLYMECNNNFFRKYNYTFKNLHEWLISVGYNSFTIAQGMTPLSDSSQPIPSHFDLIAEKNEKKSSLDYLGS